MKVSKIE